jgi:Cu-Zn family superoxide dismutase
MLRHSLIAAALAAPLPALGQSPAPVEVPVTGNAGKHVGTAQLRGGATGVVIRITLQPGAVTPGWHGIHLHAVGDCSDTAKFEKAKAHVNHGGRKHGLLNAEGPDDGDLPNVFAAADGSVNAEVFSNAVTLTGAKGLRDADGSSLVIHASEDDHSTQPIGNAGARVGCAEIR